MRYRILFIYLLITGLIASPAISFSQVITTPVQSISPTQDTVNDVEILSSKNLTILKVNDSTTLQILAGNVRLKQGNSLFNCDSCVINSNTRIFEAWGHVHINDSDTANIYASHLRYLIDKKLAYLDGGVSLTDGKGTLTTPDLEYDMTTNIGIYKNGGRVVNKKSILTSKEGYYYADLRDVYFKHNVELKDPAYYIKTDSLLYNTQSQIVRFIAQTFIRDSSGRTIETKEGFYNLQNGKAEFGQRPIIRDKNLYVTGNQIMNDDSTGVIQIRGNAIVIDSLNNTTILAGEIFVNKNTNSFLATHKPLMIIKQDNDSIYITADTLFSARLSDLYRSKDSVAKDTLKGVQVIDLGKKGAPQHDSTGKIDVVKLNNKDSVVTDTVLRKEIVALPKKDSADSIKTKPVVKLPNKNPAGKDTTRVKHVVNVNKKDLLPTDTLQKGKLVKMDNSKDSTDRYFEAYRHVRIFSDSLQAAGDSLFYSFKDSVFRLYQNPVLWAKASQITGDTILVYTKNKKADRMEVFNNSFMVNRMDPEIYNQVKSTRMDAYFKEGSLDSVRAAGLAESIYFIQDEDSAYTGINETKCDLMDIYFANETLQRVVFRSNVSGTIWPIKQKNPKDMRLENFRWLEDRRPKTRSEMYE
jgi:lipopolysaccharide export system protein LptA